MQTHNNALRPLVGVYLHKGTRCVIGMHIFLLCSFWHNLAALEQEPTTSKENL